MSGTRPLLPNERSREKIRERYTPTDRLEDPSEFDRLLEAKNRILTMPLPSYKGKGEERSELRKFIALVDCGRRSSNNLQPIAELQRGHQAPSCCQTSSAGSAILLRACEQPKHFLHNGPTDETA